MAEVIEHLPHKREALKFKPQYCQMKELQKHELEISNIILV
jgi:hypothetical protein